MISFNGGGQDFGANAVGGVPRRLKCRNCWFTVAALACAMPWAVACGTTPSAKNPTTGATGTQTGNSLLNAQGAASPMGMTDAPSSGEATHRPKMSPAAEAKYRAGMQAFQTGQIDAAEAQFEQATQADPKAYQAFYSLGIVRERKSNASGALSAYAKAIAVVSDYEPAIVSYGVLMAREGNSSEAEQYLNARLAKMEKSAAVTTALAEVMSIRGESGSAQKLAQQALKINPDYRPAMVTLVRDHYRSRRLDLALYSLQGILDGYGPENPPRDKDNPEALLIRGLIHKERNERAAAMNDFRRAIELRPDLVEARVQLAGYLLESGNAADAAPQLEWALRFERDNLLARLNLGDAYRLLSRTNESKQQLEWVAEKDPKLAQVRYSLGLLYLFGEAIPGVTPKEAASKAIAAFEEYKRLRPRSAVGQADDADELITAAKSKKAVIESQEEEAAAAKAQPSNSAAPATAPASPPQGPANKNGQAQPAAPDDGEQQ